MSDDKIDVLAVLDVACKLHKEGAYADAWEVDLARIYDVRAAVAELIEAGQYVADYVLSYSAQTYSPTARKEAHARLYDALARVRSS